MKVFLKAIMLLILLGTISATYAFAKNTLSIKKHSTVSIPIVINAEIEIESINITARYDDSMLEIEDINFDEGILSTNGAYYVLNHDVINRQITISIYAAGAMLVINQGRGKILNILVKGVGNIGQTSAFYIEEIICNNQKDCGGIDLNNTTYQKIDILMKGACNICQEKITIQNAIYALQVISGLKQNHTNCDENLNKLICMLSVLTVMNTQQNVEKKNSSRTKAQPSTATVYLNDDENYNLPVFINLPSGNIGSIFIHLIYDKGIIEVTDARFDENIFPDDEYDFYQNLKAPGGAVLGMHATQNAISAYTGNVASFDFRMIAINNGSTTLDFKSLVCNERNVSGGFIVENQIYQTVQFKPILPLFVKNQVRDVTVMEDETSKKINISSVFDIAYTNEIIPVTTSIVSNTNEQLVIVSIDDNIMTLDFQKDQSGTATIKIIGNADHYIDSYDTFNVTVKPVNDPPTITLIDNQVIEEGQSTNQISFQIDDIDTPVNQLRVWAESSNISLFPIHPDHITFGGKASNRTIKLTPAYPDFGDADISVVVSDGKDNSNMTFHARVNHVAYLIKTILQGNGTVNHPENLSVTKGQNIIYKIMPDAGFQINNVSVNGQSLGEISDYTFWSVSKSYTLCVSFIESTVYTINVIEKPGGTITPENPVKVRHGENLQFTITPDEGYCIKSLYIDDESVGPLNKYTLQKISKNHIIEADFTPISIPAADFVVSKTSGTKPLHIKFKDTSKNMIASWYWNFGDGFSSSIQHPEHTYSIPGSYTVTLQVKNQGGADTKIQQNFIEVYPNHFDFNTDINTGIAPLNVSFVDQSKGYTITNWICGNGQSITSIYPVCEYSEPGYYTVIAHAIDSENLSYSLVKRNYIRIAGRSIQGNISDVDTQAGIEGCLVELWKNNGILAGSTFTDSEGNYTASNLTIDRFYMLVWPPADREKQYYHRFYNNKDHRQDADILSTIPGDLKDINIVLKKQSAYGVQGCVKNKQGDGLQKMIVHIYSENDEFNDSTLTDENGYYTFTGLEKDLNYKISVWSEIDNSNFYYAIPEGVSYSHYTPLQSDTVRFKNKASLISPAFPYIKNIDMFVYSDGFIKGRVSAYDQPIKNVRIRAWSDLLDVGNSALTDENGWYTITGLISKSNSVSVTYIVETVTDDYSYQAYHAVVNRSNAEPLTTGHINVNFSLQSTLTVSGFVFDETGQKVPYVDISAWSQSSPSLKYINTQTNHIGAYTMTLPLAKDYVLAVYPTNSPVIYYPEVFNAHLAKTLDLTTKSLNNINITLNKGASVSGKIYAENDSGEIVSVQSGIHVSLWSQSLNKTFDTQTDFDGWFEISGLIEDVDDYILFAQSAEYLPAFFHPEKENKTVYQLSEAVGISAFCQDCDLVVKKNDETTLENNNENSADAFAHLLSENFNSDKPGRKISGYIYSYGNPIAGVEVSAWSEKTQSFGNSRTQSDGQYIISGLGIADDFIVKIKKPGILPFFFSYTTNGVLNNHLASLVSTIEGSVENINITITDCQRICGNVYNQTGQQLSNIQIIAWSETMNTGNVNYSKSDGSYCLNGLPQANDYKVSVIPVSMNYIAQEKTNVSSDKTNVNFILSKGFIIDGQIKSSDNKPIHGAEVEIRSYNNNLKKNALTDISGQFTISGISLGTDYMISVVGPKDSNYIKYHISNIVIDKDSIKEIVLNSATLIDGYIYDISGLPVENAFVTAFSQIENIQVNTRSDMDGFFAFDNIPDASDYILTASSRDYIEQTKKNISSGDRLIFNLEYSQNISGTVKYADGLPFQNALIHLYSESLSFDKTYLTNENGFYQSDALQAYQNETLVSDYCITVSIEGYAPLYKQNMSVGDQAVFIIPAGKISGIVSDIENNPIPPDVTIKAFIFEHMKQSKPISITIKDDFFRFSGLSSEKQYQILFQATGANLPEPKQWAGADNMGIALNMRQDAIAYHVGDHISFKFNSVW